MISINTNKTKQLYVIKIYIWANKIKRIVYKSKVKKNRDLYMKTKEHSIYKRMSQTKEIKLFRNVAIDLGSVQN